MRICIDPGHSGPFEPGACAGGVTEAAVTLEIAKITARMLEKYRHKVLLTRTGDVALYRQLAGIGEVRGPLETEDVHGPVGGEAVDALCADPLMCQTLGEHAFSRYVSGKKKEWDEYRKQVTDWELERYMTLF